MTGLSEEQAAERLASEGFNEIASAKPRSVLAIAWAVVREPMLLLLVAAGIINLVIASSTREPERLREAVLLFVFVFVVIGITFYQERKTERALDALRDLSSPRALVIRAGLQRRVAGREVVRADLILLAEGDRVPADAILLDCTNLSVDESLLTGESVPVRKAKCGAETEMGRPGGDGTPFVYSGTLVVKGQGVAKVAAVGISTELGKIGQALSSIKQDRTRLQRDVDSIVGRVAVVGLSLAAVIMVVYSLTRGDWLKGSLAGISLAMAMLPEEFPVVLTVFLALGAWRLSQRHVLTRRVPAIETLGAATVLCSDKTGTLTQNRMTVRSLHTADGDFEIDGVDELPEAFHHIVEYTVLASPVDPFDPMDAAFKVLGNRFLSQTEHLHADWALVREYPLSEHLLALSHVWRSPGGGDYVIAAKGAPEAIADLCHFDETRCNAMSYEVARMADRGLRVLGVARATFSHDNGLPEVQHDFEFEWMGLVGLQDPIRPTVPRAVAECYSAGVRVVMITGDYPGTAISIAKEIGLKPADQVITGPDLDGMTDEQLEDRIGEVCIFARVVPEQKLRIVRALKDHGEVVAMTGDGVNDAPALKAADIGIAMGERGTDVAREAAALVLTDDDFSSIVGAVRMGRRIFDNLKKAMAYILAVHVPIAGMSLIPVLVQHIAGRESVLVLLPVHIAFLELIIDPACSVVFEAECEERGIMARPPRGVDEPMFGRRMLTVSFAQGAVVLAAVLGVYYWAMSMPVAVMPDTAVRGLTFVTLVTANLALIFINRSWTHTVIGGLRLKNVALWWVTVGTLAVLAFLLALPAARDMFQFAVMHPSQLAVAMGAGILSVVWFEVYKVVMRGRHAPVA
jgi:Ca2+-transporting ATPase